MHLLQKKNMKFSFRSMWAKMARPEGPRQKA